MAGRRPKVTDDDVFAAAQRAMSRRGPHELTLAEVDARPTWMRLRDGICRLALPYL